MTACADTLLNTLQTPVVRDLAWACFCPPLILSNAVAPTELTITNCGLSLDSRRQEWLEQLDQKPRALNEHLESVHSRRLGLYFEALWHFFLDQDDRVELLAHNLPVRDSGQTIGEFDCLYYCRERQRNFHLELAVKYYLGLPHAHANAGHSGWNCWLGPGTRDRLDLKMDRLLQHQMRLGQHPAARAVLEDLGIGQMELEMEIKGRLFNCRRRPIPPPHGHNPDLALLSWTTLPESTGGADWVVLDKRHWLAPVTPASGLAPAHLPLQSITTPRLVGKLDKNGNELERFFLVPARWPEQA